MGDLVIEVLHWLPLDVEDPLERETLASLRMSAGGDDITKVEDLAGKSVRPHVNVSAYSLAHWLITNWWRLRWEPERETPGFDWLESHSLAAIGGGFAWPPLIISSDGEFVRFRMQEERTADVSAVRYLNRLNEDVPACDFEQAVDGFLDSVLARFAATNTAAREMLELREELRLERTDCGRASMCRLEARAGFDPGAAPETWREAARRVVATVGQAATEEVAAVAPVLPDGLSTAETIISAIRASSFSANLDWTSRYREPVWKPELPWERGARLAAEVRAGLNLAPGPISNGQLNELLETSIPLETTSCPGLRDLHGGFRDEKDPARTRLLVHSPRPDSQRFQLARLVGASIVTAGDQRLLPVTSGSTAPQKFERSFAQEFLCPWSDLDAYTDEHGTDDDAIADAAEHFSVFEMLVLSTLVNKGKVPRYRLGV